MKQVDFLTLETEQNQKSGTLGYKHQIGTFVGRCAKQVLVGTYDFATQGGAVGTITLKDQLGTAVVIPKGAIVLAAHIDVLTPLTSGGGATVAVNSGQTAADLKAATAIGSLTGVVAGIPQGLTTTAIKATADNTMSVTIATAALTAGKINVLVEYVISL